MIELRCSICGENVAPSDRENLIFPSSLNPDGALRSVTRLDQEGTKVEICYQCILHGKQKGEFKTNREFWDSKHNFLVVGIRKAIEGLGKFVLLAIFFLGVVIMVWIVSHFGWAGLR